MSVSRRRDIQLQEVSERQAHGEVAETYERIKDTLQVGLVNFVWRVFATKPKFLRVTWEELEPAVDRWFGELADAIRAMAIRRVREATTVPDHRSLLGDDLARAAEELRVFLEVNPKLLILMCGLRRSWNGDEVGGARKAIATSRGVPEWHPKVDVAGDHVLSRAKGTLDEICEVLDLPAPNTDYRVLAKWPEYLATAWGDLRPFVGTQAWMDLCTGVDAVAEQGALALPSPIRISPDRAGELGLAKKEIDEVGSWIDLFHGLLPGLIVNTSYFWLGLFGGTTELPAPAPPPVESP